MSERNSYPSPVSTSSRLEQRSRTPPPVEDGPLVEEQRRRSLDDMREQISDRIRQARRDLLSFNNVQSSSSSSTGTDHNNIGPAHDAIVLSRSFDDEPSQAGLDLERLREGFSTMMEHLMASEAAREQERRNGGHHPENAARELISALDSITDIAAHIPQRPAVSPSWTGSINSPISPPRQNLLPLRSLAESPSTRPRQMSDDPNTYLGHRVAARQSGSVPTPDAASQSLGENRIRLLRETLDQHVDRMRQSRRQQSSLLTSQSPIGTDSGSSRNNSTPSRTDSSNSSSQRSGSLASQMVNARREWSFRRMRMLRESSRGTGSQSQGTGSLSTTSSHNTTRLSTLSGLSSLQNLPVTSSSATGPRPLIFDEPVSYIPEEGTGMESRSDSVVGEPSLYPADSQPSRLYHVRRRLNADGDEYVGNIDLRDLDDSDAAAWLIPSRDRLPSTDAPSAFPRYGFAQSSRHRREDTVQIPAGTDETPRRRYWARLDADGDEISSDEEREMERQRALRRQEATQRGDHLVPMTRHVLHPLPDDDHRPRVRINRRDDLESGQTDKHKERSSSQGYLAGWTVITAGYTSLSHILCMLLSSFFFGLSPCRTSFT